MGFKLTENTKKYLLSEARRVLSEALQCGFLTEVVECDENEKRIKAGAFVSLYKKGDLRGCVGMIAAIKPLEDTVREMAEAAAFYDNRFEPLRADELQDIDIEITVLSSPILTGIEDIVVGRDGLIIDFMGRHGVLLPQVPVEYGWSKEEFLDHLCLKAGLPPDTWKNYDVVLYRFEGEYFGERSKK